MSNNTMIFPIGSYSSPGKNEIAYWENFLTNEDIHYICSRNEWLNPQTAQVGGGADTGIVAPEKRRTNIGWMFRDEHNHHIWEKIGEAIWQVNRQFFQFDLDGCYEAAQLGIYTDQNKDHYDWHCDSGLETETAPRKLSVALSLSDPSEFEGGELQIINSGGQIENLELKKGRAWFFPSWQLHRVTPVTRGMRRSLVLWVGGPAFK